MKIDDHILPIQKVVIVSLITIEYPDKWRVVEFIRLGILQCRTCDPQLFDVHLIVFGCSYLPLTVHIVDWITRIEQLLDATRSFCYFSTAVCEFVKYISFSLCMLYDCFDVRLFAHLCNDGFP